jgi:alpha-galactosidase
MAGSPAPRIVFIGAGSLVFAKVLAMDLLATPALRGCELVLVSRTARKLEWTESYVRRLIADNGLPATVWATTDRRRALEGADFVIAMLQVGGVDAFTKDYEIPRRYGVDLCIANDGGPAGVMRSARTIPVMLAIARDMQELCPEALLLNYVNPMAAVCMALDRASSIRTVGLCHGVQVTLDLIARYTDTPKEEIRYLAAGINHMCWFLTLESRGRDLYPLLRARCEQPEYYLPEKVRCETLRHFGYFMTESSGHLSDYLPYFRKSPEARALYCDQPGFGGESGAAPRNYARGTALFRERNVLAGESTTLQGRSIEHGSYLIEAAHTGAPYGLNANVINRGSITNLPDAACVEIPVIVDRAGVHPQPVEELPPQLAALCQTNITVQTLTVEACLARDLELLFQAMALDPLSSAVLTLREIRDLAIELIEAERDYLPGFAGQSLRPKPAIHIPPGTEAVRTPLDPALAVVHHLKVLADKVRETPGLETEGSGKRESARRNSGQQGLETRSSDTRE